MAFPVPLRILKGRTWFASLPRSRLACDPYDRAWHPSRQNRADASQIIDEIGARNADDAPIKRKRAIGNQIRERVHQVRRSRNYWAHDDADATDVPMGFGRAKMCLLAYTEKMPLEWGD